MRGIILAGGTGSRLYPLTRVTNKHLLPVGQEPMIYHPLRKLIEVGITQILVVTGVEHMGAVVGALGSGHQFDCELTYRVQDRAGGIAEALGLARDFARNERMVVILGDNIFQDSLQTSLEAFQNQKSGARLLLKEVQRPERFGVASCKDHKITAIIEKPQAPVSNLAVTGIYFYDEQVFSFIDQLSPSARNELEITDVNNFYLKQNQLEFDLMQGWWTDAGTFSSLQHANQLMASSQS